MKILLTTLEGNIFPVEVSEDLEVINLKALCEQETRIEASKIALTHNGQPLIDDAKSLSSYNVRDNDILMVQQIRAAPRAQQQQQQSSTLPFNIDFSSISVPTPNSAQSPRQRTSQSNSLAPPASSQVANLDSIRQLLQSDPERLAAMRIRFPELISALDRNDSVQFTQMMNSLARNDQQIFGAGAGGNEFDLETQNRIAENIRLQNIQQNMEHALEYMPEAFGNVVMLYIDCQVNGHHVKAFVDSGAQMTIMSSACAERCDIMRLVDKRWAGVAKGVGTQKIVGRVHLAQIQIEKSHLTTSFSILEEQPMDMLLGLDILRRHQCVIDLKENALVFSAANIKTKFLPENELPGFARLNTGQEEEAPVAMEPEPSTSTDSKSTPGTNTTTESGKTGDASGSSATSSNTDPFPEKTISNLLKLGFQRADIIEALKASNGDENNASIALLAKSLKPPSK